MKYWGKEMDTEIVTGRVAMTWEDAERMEKRNEKHSWSFGFTDVMRMFADHMDAFDARTAVLNANATMEAIRKSEMIEWRLEDANFHAFANMLHDNDYDGALKWILKEYTELEVA